MTPEEELKLIKKRMLAMEIDINKLRNIALGFGAVITQAQYDGDCVICMKCSGTINPNSTCGDNHCPNGLNN